VLRSISAPSRFSVRTAIAIVFGVVIAEFVANWFVGRLYNLGSTTGLWTYAADDIVAESTLLIVAKLLATAAVAWWTLQASGETWRDTGRLRFSPVILALAFVPLIASVTIFLSEIDNLLRALLPEFIFDRLDFAPDLELIVTTSWQGPVLAVVIAPLTEELVFRGLILRGLLGRWRPAMAILASAFLFALTHFNPAQAPVALMLGALLGWIYVRTRSLGLCMIGHALNNAATYAVELFPFEVAGFNLVPDSDGPIFHPWWFNAIALALLALGLWLIHRLAPALASWRVAAPATAPTVPPIAEPPLLAPPLLPRQIDRGEYVAPSTDSALPSSMSIDLTQLVTSLAQRARAAALKLATVPRERKDAALEKLAELIDGSYFELLQANQRDLLSPEAGALTPAARDRLTLTEDRLRHLAASVREVAALPDPVGTVLEDTTRPNGLHIRKVRVPIGVIGIIYEARPNVTIDCAILCLKSGNAAILRGGKECFHTNMALAALVQGALTASGLPADAVQLVPTTDRAALNVLLKLDTLIHCIIPRGGESLIRYVAQNSTIPVIKHYKGVCFVYVDQAADLAMAETITLNAKVQRPSACNAAEQLLVHRAVADRFLPAVARALLAKNVQLRGDPASAAILAREGLAVTPATAADFTTEFLDYVIAIRVVESVDDAIATINRDSSNHSDAIVTADAAAARRFLAEVDSATVYWNASTRFTDGFEFGYGAEIGISTDRLHARGPMGLPELCSYKFLIEGTGQVRT
jgi:glutamate-5-semialdehyde dehydrogenase